jgi:hypothetical protein
MKIYVADAHAYVQMLVLVFKIATVLEENTTEEQRSLVRFLWTKGLNANDIYEEMFPLYGGKYLQHKAVHNYVENVSLMKMLKRRGGSGGDNSQKTSMLQVSTPR